MEKLVKIISQGAHSVRTYNGGNGEPMAFHYMDFELTDGIDTFHAQATGNLSQALQPLDKDVLHKVQCHISHRTFERQDGSPRPLPVREGSPRDERTRGRGDENTPEADGNLVPTLPRPLVLT